MFAGTPGAAALEKNSPSGAPPARADVTLLAEAADPNVTLPANATVVGAPPAAPPAKSSPAAGAKKAPPSSVPDNTLISSPGDTPLPGKKKGAGKGAAPGGARPGDNTLITPTSEAETLAAGDSRGGAVKQAQPTLMARTIAWEPVSGFQFGPMIAAAVLVAVPLLFWVAAKVTAKDPGSASGGWISSALTAPGDDTVILRPGAGTPTGAPAVKLARSGSQLVAAAATGGAELWKFPEKGKLYGSTLDAALTLLPRSGPWSAIAIPGKGGEAIAAVLYTGDSPSPAILVQLLDETGAPVWEKPVALPDQPAPAAPVRWLRDPADTKGTSLRLVVMLAGGDATVIDPRTGAAATTRP